MNIQEKIQEFFKVNEVENQQKQECLHKQCDQCHGAGVHKHGICVHAISCPCKKCAPFSF